MLIGWTIMIHLTRELTTKTLTNYKAKVQCLWPGVHKFSQVTTLYEYNFSRNRY